ncbi:uncharacterized protein [Parasteatoda tepidariorum]|uniref:uncharacterized protein n=1 Tax=Parasteatoda tepidariorum TaxID=114398 RepID=UPI00077FE10D|nr:uncharacterized protein LOC107439637 [Parasteatoda tepidariorum]XP_015907789.1 uncharacterized protein LOC107439637 [Parasteatoda tepidariorum]
MSCRISEVESQPPRPKSPCRFTDSPQQHPSGCMFRGVEVDSQPPPPRPKSPCRFTDSPQQHPSGCMFRGMEMESQPPRPKSPCRFTDSPQQHPSGCMFRGIEMESQTARPKSPCRLTDSPQQHPNACVFRGLEAESQPSRPKSPCRIAEAPQLHRIQNNYMMLDLRKQIQWQSQVIRDLKIERDRLTKELASRLFYVEAQLRREQKHIESLLKEKDQYIRFQGLQIESLKTILSKVDWDYRRHQDCNQKSRSATTNLSVRRGKVPPPLDKRFSYALDEYMKDHGVVSRAQPVIVQADSEGDKKPQKQKDTSYGCFRARSLPELRIDKTTENRNPSCSFSSYYQSISDLGLPQDIIDELASRRWTSDCDSEHSDSLDSGISSPSIKSRNMHAFPMPPVSGAGKVKQDNSSQRRCSIGNFLNRTFSLSSSQLDKIKDNEEYQVKNVPSRRHGSFSVSKNKSFDHDCHVVRKPEEEPKPRNRFISSANRTFGTNHRSVTKPRDIKFRKLFKFRRRSEPIDQGAINPEDYMTV